MHADVIGIARDSQIYYMMKKVENLIKRNYKMHYNVKQDLSSDRSMLKEDVDVPRGKPRAAPNIMFLR